MATTLRQIEGAPENIPEASYYPTLSTAAKRLDKAMLWQRIETYIAFRYSERAVTWIVEGPGPWSPPLAPAQIETVEVWSSGAWEEVSLEASPLDGYCLSACGPYRFTATVGGGSPEPEPPEIVMEAFRRLAEYMAARPGTPGASRESKSIGTALDVSYSRSASFMAHAMQNSGAADLLRSFRRC